VPTEVKVKGSLLPGGTITLDSGVTNKGEMESGKFEVAWTVNYKSVMDSDVHANVPAGATVMDGNSAATWTPKRAGKYVIGFILDSCNKVKELDERNNAVYKTIYVQK
jgi:subtilase family serine protease